MGGLEIEVNYPIWPTCFFFNSDFPFDRLNCLTFVKNVSSLLVQPIFHILLP